MSGSITAGEKQRVLKRDHDAHGVFCRGGHSLCVSTLNPTGKMSPDRARLKALYALARGGSSFAIEEILKAGSRQLCSWLGRHTRAAIELRREVAEDAFITTLLKSESLPSWPQAWCYARKTARGLLRRRAQGQAICSLWTTETLDRVQSHGLDAPSVDLLEALEGKFKNLSPEKIQILISIVSGRPGTKELARLWSKSERTVRRQQAILRTWLRRQIRDCSR